VTCVFQEHLLKRKCVARGAGVHFFRLSFPKKKSLFLP
jgi:hypothetical protein